MSQTVLIVEDEFLIAMDLALMVKDCGWRVIGPASTVRQALRLIEEELPAVVLLDVNLGAETVTPVAEALNARDVPFAVASAYSKPENVGGQVLAGRPDVGKPTTARRVREVLTQLIEQSSG